MAKIDRRSSTECWPWLAGHFADGYAAFYLHGRNEYAHRVVYQLLVAVVPRWQPLEKAGGCVRRDCVNPAHWKPGAG
jgi:hypothetical protein